MDIGMRKIRRVLARFESAGQMFACEEMPSRGRSIFKCGFCGTLSDPDERRFCPCGARLIVEYEDESGPRCSKCGRDVEVGMLKAGRCYECRDYERFRPSQSLTNFGPPPGELLRSGVTSEKELRESLMGVQVKTSRFVPNGVIFASNDGLMVSENGEPFVRLGSAPAYPAPEPTTPVAPVRTIGRRKISLVDV